MRRGEIEMKINIPKEVNMKLKARHYGMLSRCYDPNNKYFQDYGGRGIKVASDLQNFDSFLEFAINDLDILNNLHLSIDRIDNNKGYSRDNIRLATPKEQSNNRRGRGDSQTGCVGVTIENGMFTSYITLNGKRYRVPGRYTELDDAVQNRKSMLWLIEKQNYTIDQARDIISLTSVEYQRKPSLNMADTCRCSKNMLQFVKYSH